MALSLAIQYYVYLKLPLPKHQKPVHERQFIVQLNLHLNIHKSSILSMYPSLENIHKSILFIYYRSCTATKSSSLCTDDALADQLWKLSSEAVGL